MVCRRTWCLIVLTTCMVVGYFWTECYHEKDVNPTGHDTDSLFEIKKVKSSWDKAPCKRSPGTSSTSTPVTLASKNSCSVYNPSDNPEVETQRKLILKGPIYTVPGQVVVTNSYGLTNLASLYLGGKVVKTKETIPFVPPDIKCGPVGCTNSVETIISPEVVVVGKNWRFKGKQGAVMIQLAKPSFIVGFTLIHPPKGLITPDYFTSAPKGFYVYGMESFDDPTPEELGKFIYLENGPPAQTFQIQQSTCIGKYKLVLVKFVENHGNADYTAVYKFEVHGSFDTYKDVEESHMHEELGTGPCI